MIGFVPVCFGVDAVEATTAMHQAELSLNSAYVAVAVAHAVEADVGELLEKLEVAGGFLSKAHLEFRSGDYEAASMLAMECGNAVEGIVVEADQLKASAERSKTESTLFTAFWSGLGLILLVVFGFVVWTILKARYFERILEMRPLEESR